MLQVKEGVCAYSRWLAREKVEEEEEEEEEEKGSR